jgi:hypothetical protein
MTAWRSSPLSFAVNSFSNPPFFAKLSGVLFCTLFGVMRREKYVPPALQELVVEATERQRVPD